MHNNSKSESYAAAGVDITAGYKAVELMKKHIARTKNEGQTRRTGECKATAYFYVSRAAFEEQRSMRGFSAVARLNI